MELDLIDIIDWRIKCENALFGREAWSLEVERKNKRWALNFHAEENLKIVDATIEKRSDDNFYWNDILIESFSQLKSYVDHLTLVRLQLNQS